MDDAHVAGHYAGGRGPPGPPAGSARALNADHVERIRDILTALGVAMSPRDMAQPGYRLHRLTGDRRGRWSVRVSGNWRIVFRFADDEAVDVDLVDYR